MADIKFQCPECQQRIAVDDSAAGVPIACPACGIGLTIPAKTGDPVKVVFKPKAAAPAEGTVSTGEGGDAAGKELREKQKALEVALADTAKLRIDLEAVSKERDAARAEGSRFKSELEKARGNLASVPKEIKKPEQPAAAPKQAGAPGSGGDLELLTSRMAALERELEQTRERAKRAEDELGIVTAAVTMETEAGPQGTRIPPPAPSNGPSSKVTLVVNQRDELRAEVARLKDALATVTTERDHLKAGTREGRTENAALRTEMETALKKVEGEQRKLKELGESFATSERERIELAMRVSQNPEAKELAGMKEKVAALQAQLSDAQVGSQTFRTERDRVRMQLAERDEALKAAGKAIEAAKIEVDRIKQEAASGAGRAAEVQEEAKGLKQRVDGLSNDLQVREKELAEAREALGAMTKAREEAEGRANGASKELESRAQELSEARTAATAAAQKQSEIQQRAETLEVDLRSREKELSQEREALAAAKKGCETAEQRANSLAETLTAREKEISEAKAAAAAATKAGDEARAKLSSVEAQAVERASALTGVEANAKRLEEELASVSATLARTTSELSGATKFAREQSERAEAAERALSAARVEIGGLKQKVASVGDQLAEQTTRREESLRRIEAVETELAQRTGELGAARYDLDRVIQREKKRGEGDQAREREWTEKVAQFSGRTDEEKARADSLAAELEQERANAGNSGEKLKSLESELAATREELDRMEADRSRLLAMEDAGSTGDDDMGGGRKVEQALEKVRIAETERDEARREAVGHREGLERAKQHIAVLQSRRDQMREEIAKLKVKLGLAPDAVV